MIPYSLALTPEVGRRGTFAIIPQSDHRALHQRMVLLTRAGATAVRFYDYLQTDAARAIFRKHGYGVPG
jgi:molybdate transport system substrate-binding protein